MSEDGNRKNVVLHSWKEIASYVGRGMRTVQRWEAECGMPVHRPRGKSRSAVLAFADEIDKWLRSDRNPEVRQPELKPYAAKEIEALLLSREIVEQSALLRDRCVLLCSENKKALDTLLLNMQKLRESVKETRILRPAASAD